MSYNNEEAFPNILKDTENTRSGGGVGRKFVPTRKLGSNPGARAGDRFRRGRGRSTLRARHLSGITKATNHSGNNNTASKHGLLSGKLIQDNAISSTTTSLQSTFSGLDVKDSRTDQPDICPKFSDRLEAPISEVQTEVISSTAGDEFFSSSGACDHGDVKVDRKRCPKQEHEEFLAYIREIRAKSTTLLNDVKRFRYDLKVYRLSQ